MRIGELGRRIGALVLTLGFGLTAAPASASPLPTGFVHLRDIDPTIIQEMRYAGQHNFVGRPVDGYLRPTCILTRPAALALHEAQKRVLRQGYTLKVYDCYRPQRAVDHFVRWAKDLADEKMKPEFYPRVEKSRLFEDGYIAEKSGHSRGSTLDLTLVKLPPRWQRPYFPGEPLRSCFTEHRFPDNMVDMGTGFDCFDTLAHTDDPRVTDQARINRDVLRDALVGFKNLPEEWWHYTLVGEPYPATFFNFPVK
ncbi:M15 family metallopeptidase [Amycolatopsis sp. cg5]|uniref:M15 family metallopeptidase n=1 Tax=Amycolatopsis sp. cg5 TaxID=3238802 RepID=UPI003523FA37